MQNPCPTNVGLSHLISPEMRLRLDKVQKHRRGVTFAAVLCKDSGIQCTYIVVFNMYVAIKL